MEESQHLGWELEQLSKTTENCQGEINDVMVGEQSNLQCNLSK